MVYRVKQFLKGVFAWTRKEDYELLDEYLNFREKQLFVKLPCHERHHALDTAAMIKFIAGDYAGEALIKAGLLHDIGKTGSGINIFKKSILVLTDKCFPKLSRQLSKKVSMFNVYYNHPEIGAQILENIGENRIVVQLVRYHHTSKDMNIDGIEILKRADSLS